MGARLINARSETVLEKPSFREAFKKRRCIIPADGFYEWARTGGRKQPYYFRLRDDQPFGFAGLWDRWEDQDGEVIESCTILTTEANEVLASVHDRMPVILHPRTYELWLNSDSQNAESLKELLQPFPESEMTGYPVSTRVNDPQADGDNLLERWKINTA